MLNFECDSFVDSLLVNPVPDFIEEVPKKSNASFVPLREDQNLSERFMDGVANLRIDVKIKGQNGSLGIWLCVHPTESQRTLFPQEFPVFVSGDPDEAGNERPERIVFATAHFEQISDDFTFGRGVWLALLTQRWLNCIVPPLGWHTNHQRLDLRIAKRDNSPKFADYCANLSCNIGRDDLEVISKKLPEHMRVVVSPRGVVVTFDALGNHTFEVVEIIVGPFDLV
jgi:hypothetical protein